MNITREELEVAIQQAHAHKLKLTGHLCSVTWPGAIALGIDDFEHGPVFTDTEFVSDKKPDVCPAGGGSSDWAKQDVNGTKVQELIHKSRVPPCGSYFHATCVRVWHHGTTEAASAHLGCDVRRISAKLSDRPRQSGLDSPTSALLREEMDFELAFAKAGGLLLAGPDPTGNDGVLPGFGESTRNRAARRSGLRSGRSNSDRHTKWRRIPWPARSNRNPRAWQTGGPGFDQRRSIKPD
jgi:hypothetical protein